MCSESTTSFTLIDSNSIFTIFRFTMFNVLTHHCRFSLQLLQCLTPITCCHRNVVLKLSSIYLIISSLLMYCFFGNDVFFKERVEILLPHREKTTMQSKPIIPTSL